MTKGYEILKKQLDKILERANEPDLKEQALKYREDFGLADFIPAAGYFIHKKRNEEKKHVKQLLYEDFSLFDSWTHADGGTKEFLKETTFSTYQLFSPAISAIGIYALSRLL